MNFQVLRKEQDYNEALKELEKIFDSKTGTFQGDQLDVLSFIIDQYEKEHFPIEHPSLRSAIDFRMEQLGVKGD